MTTCELLFADEVRFLHYYIYYLTHNPEQPYSGKRKGARERDDYHAYHPKDSADVQLPTNYTWNGNWHFVDEAVRNPIFIDNQDLVNTMKN